MNQNMKFENLNDSEADKLIGGFNSNEHIIQLHCVKILRGILSRPNPDIDRVLKLNVLKPVLEKMVEVDDPEFQLECAWIITNLLSGYQDGVNEVLRLNGMDHLKKMLRKTEDINVKCQVFWAFANITCENARCRDLVVAKGILNELIDFVEVAKKSQDELILKTSIWALGNFFLSRFPELPENVRHTGLEVFLKFFRHPNDLVYQEAIYGINNIIETGETKFIDKIAKLRILKHIKVEIENLNCNQKIFTALIHTVGFVTQGNDQQTQKVIDCGFIPLFFNFLSSKDTCLVKTVLWILANIAFGPISHIRTLMSAGIYVKVLDALTHENTKIRREAIWTIYHSTKGYEKKDAVIHLVRLEVLRHLTKLLDDPDEGIVVKTCDSIYNILTVGQSHFKEVNLFAVLVEKYGALKKLEFLQIHPSWTVIEKSILVLESFFKNSVSEVPKI